VLQVFEESRARGEMFVKWFDPTDKSSHDGTFVFAHHMVMRYVSLHTPGMSVLFDIDGALKSTSVRFNNIRRYIWAHRVPLARRCNDMSKQMYSQKKWATKAWHPLHEWLFADPPSTSLRLSRLHGFGREDTEFHSVVALCLWRFAHLPNTPWGLAATQPRGYSVVTDVKQVLR